MTYDMGCNNGEVRGGIKGQYCRSTFLATENTRRLSKGIGIWVETKGKWGMPDNEEEEGVLFTSEETMSRKS